MQPSFHILLVDDDEMSRELLALLLSDKGYRVTVAESGDEALRMLPCSGVHAVLTDMQMPGISGSELAKRMRDIAPNTRLVAMSGSQPQPENLLGYDNFLLKPFTMEQFAQACAQTSAARLEIESNDRESESGSVAGEALDRSVYAKLATSMPPAQLLQLYALCLSDAEQRIANMRELAARDDDEGYRRAAHQIKGGCGMVGAIELQRLADKMEQQGLSTANHVASLDEFLLATERLRRILVAP